MKIILLFLVFVLAGCSAPSVRQADFSLAEANLSAAYSIANPEAKAQIAKAQRQLESAKAACLASVESLDQAVEDKNRAMAEAEQWRQKQRKALKELWLWRGAAIVAALFALKGPIFWLARKLIGIPW